MRSPADNGPAEVMPACCKMQHAGHGLNGRRVEPVTGEESGGLSGNSAVSTFGGVKFGLKTSSSAEGNLFEARRGSGYDKAANLPTP